MELVKIIKKSPKIITQKALQEKKERPRLTDKMLKEISEQLIVSLY